MNKETIYYSYEVICQHRNKGSRFAYGRLKPARMLVKYLKKEDRYTDIKLNCVCYRYDNHGTLYVGYGKTKLQAYNDTLPYIECDLEI